MAININGKCLQASISEIIGYKSGLALSTPEMIELLEGDKSYLLRKNGWLRIYPEEIEQLIADLLYAVGNINSPSMVPISIELHHELKHIPEKYSVYLKILNLFNGFLKKEIKENTSRGKNSIDPSSFAREAEHKFGAFGLKIAFKLLEGISHQQHINPWSNTRLVSYKNTLELKELFESASLEAEYGNFIDQRFIDFLSQHFEAIDVIHWRKFEALAAEFFDRQGYIVKMGPGSNDGGVDIRAWKKDVDLSSPASILVQCKKTKSKVEKSIVKALWADVFHENAESGLIVTTSSISPGARQDCIARQYPIGEANRSTLKEWICQMRTPNKGVFMGE
jgi:restriction system protein